MGDLVKIKNRLWLTYSYLKRETYCRGFPVEITAGITESCNVDCIMCPRKKVLRGLGDMEDFVFEKIVEESKDLVELIWLHGRGEPLLDARLFEMIEYCKKRGLRVGISTNSTLLNREKAYRLIESDLDILLLPFDGATKKTYESIRRGAIFEEVLNNIKTFLNFKTKLKKGPYTEVQLIYMQDTKDEVKDFLRMWKIKGVDEVRIKPLINFPGLDKSLGVSSKPKVNNQPCILLWRQMNIHSDGTVVACCNDYFAQFPLGNVKTASLFEIWNSRVMQGIRKSHVLGKSDEMSICRDCNVRQPPIPFILGSIFIDDLTLKRLLPKLEKLIILKKLDWLGYF